jgi:hypothetical protein
MEGSVTRSLDVIAAEINECFRKAFEAEKPQWLSFGYHLLELRRHYATEHTFERKLKNLGVKVDLGRWCMLLAEHEDLELSGYGPGTLPPRPMTEREEHEATIYDIRFGRAV